MKSACCLWLLIGLLGLTGSRSIVQRLTAALSKESARTQPVSIPNDGSMRDRKPKPSRRYLDTRLTQPARTQIEELLPQESRHDPVGASEDVLIRGPRASTPAIAPRIFATPVYLQAFHQAAFLGSLSLRHPHRRASRRADNSPQRATG